MIFQNFIFRDVQSVTDDVSKSISQKTKKNSYSIHTSSIDAPGTRIQEKSVSFFVGQSDVGDNVMMVT